MRALFRRYLDARLATYANVKSAEQTAEANAEALRQQDAIWKLAVDALSRPGSAASAPMLLLPALNAMFDTAEMRRRVVTHHPPVVIYGMLATFAALVLVAYRLARVRDPRLAAVGVGALAMYAFYAIEEMTSFSLRHDVPLLAFWILAGLTAAALRIAEADGLAPAPGEVRS